MKQRKQKPGKLGSRSSRGPQSADRKDKFVSASGSVKGRRDRGDTTSASSSGSQGKSRPAGPYRVDREEKASRPSPRAATRHQAGEDFRPSNRQQGGGPQGPYWLFGHHAVSAALANPRRRIQRLVHLSGEAPLEGSLADGSLADQDPDRILPPWEPIDRPVLERLLPEGAVHQGIAARVAPLPEIDLYEICDLAQSRQEVRLLILDQVTDPHNVGAILRSAAAFGALAVILTERHAAPETGTLAKAASGALEVVPLVRVGNLARAMEQLKEAGFWLAGLAAEGRSDLAGAKLSGKVGLVLGAEGPGLRRLTRDHCDLLVRLPTSGPISHLNVSNAAAVALYELVRATPAQTASAQVTSED
ncbi:MAG: 23S rRNA (guanosine(2251)-2'-O)-methyltransferase RlmB [Rhodospirillaceae bacterium]|nr:MAG: 23S rRNA (guanosine(2251)-2'-O)-methyltransferase RlmB [Rhodospirillaceae bacterium]